ncbi:hypothetical protein [Magnetospirillum sulfuroxidans]|uniref:Uncharacterized protein n=1 Tax=Magnetospirillum sulfuroxidans TaxID=611300 RepID=A0ABS5I9I1_9PROT|nr:hypothetical protein [Magnetospirillum sulfuroxidans]MBR9970812.1 hypothetical protein [Magnetospirillum sulfuroxidans]
MAYIAKNLEYVGGALISHWNYVTTDTAATVDTAGYFNSASSVLKVGDRIHANVDTGGTPAYGTFVVLSNAAGVVDVADMTAMTATDTD